MNTQVPKQVCNSCGQTREESFVVSHHASVSDRTCAIIFGAWIAFLSAIVIVVIFKL
jgi:hypothetical protein